MPKVLSSAWRFSGDFVVVVSLDSGMSKKTILKRFKFPHFIVFIVYITHMIMVSPRGYSSKNNAKIMQKNA